MAGYGSTNHPPLAAQVNPLSAVKVLWLRQNAPWNIFQSATRRLIPFNPFGGLSVHPCMQCGHQGIQASTISALQPGLEIRTQDPERRPSLQSLRLSGSSQL